MFSRFNTEGRGVLAIAVVLLLAAGLLPWLAPNQFYIHIGNIACLNLMFVLGLAIIARVGQLSMGHAGFALIGGYVSALLAMKAGWSPIWGVLAAGACGYDAMSIDAGRAVPGRYVMQPLTVSPAAGAPGSGTIQVSTAPTTLDSRRA